MYYLLAIILCLPLYSGQNQGKPKNHEQKTESAAQAAPTPSPTIQKSPTPESTKTPDKKNDTTTPEPKPWLTHGEWVMAVLTGIYVVLTFVYVCISRGTLNAILRQEKDNAEQFTKQLAEATKSADAAKASADALVASERAWIIPELANSKPGLYILRLTNKGRTPGQILSYELRYSCLPEWVTDLPSTGGDNHSSWHEFNMWMGAEEILEVGDLLNISEFMKKEQQDINALKKTAVFHGTIKYKHMFSDTEECHSDFCYVYTVSRSRLSKVGRHTKYK